MDSFLQFITGRNVILVRNRGEFETFLEMLEYHKVTEILGRKPNAKTLAYWQDLAVINGKNPNLFCFEYQPGKGLSWYDNTKQPTDGYGIEPIVLERKIA